ncbi:hypothetical protein [Mesorhizobium sp. CN2-181]|uniref:hypothetical protein n=1 Tax=Mesorhizobium yinganensis TaxID=3157707 RepID=UPI0032B70521
MIEEWISKLSKLAVWHRWLEERDDRVEFNVARRYVAAVERKDRDEAERIAAGIKVPFRKRNQDKLRIALDLIYRRVPGGGSDASIGGSYRTMSEREYAGSVKERLADARYESMTNPQRASSGNA